MGTPTQTYRNQCIVALYESGKLTQQEIATVFQVSQGLVRQIYARSRQDGLVHISQLTDKFVKDPNAVVKVRQKVQVKVVEVDAARKRIALTMRLG